MTFLFRSTFGFTSVISFTLSMGGQCEDQGCSSKYKFLHSVKFNVKINYN